MFGICHHENMSSCTRLEIIVMKLVCDCEYDAVWSGLFNWPLMCSLSCCGDQADAVCDGIDHWQWPGACPGSPPPHWATCQHVSHVSARVSLYYQLLSRVSLSVLTVSAPTQDWAGSGAVFTGPEGYTGFTHHCLDTNLLQVSKTGSKLWDGLTTPQLYSGHTNYATIVLSLETSWWLIEKLTIITSASQAELS